MHLFDHTNPPDHRHPPRSCLELSNLVWSIFSFLVKFSQIRQFRTLQLIIFEEGRRRIQQESVGFLFCLCAFMFYTRGLLPILSLLNPPPVQRFYPLRLPALFRIVVLSFSASAMLL
jgi:hypothetical protein